MRWWCPWYSSEATPVEPFVEKFAKEMADKMAPLFHSLNAKKAEISSRVVKIAVVRAQRVCRLLHYVCEKNSLLVNDIEIAKRCEYAIDFAADEIAPLDQVLSGVPAEKYTMSKFKPQTMTLLIMQAASRKLY